MSYSNAVEAGRVLDPRVWYIAQDMLKDVIRLGTGRAAQSLGRDDLGGKTGTTNDQRDAWFSGYQKEVVTVVWVGFDEPKSLGDKEFGSTVALPIWNDFMSVALKDVPEAYSIKPRGLLVRRIDPNTGRRASNNDENAIDELFRFENEP
jgi:penicillin-binding protein 1A